MVMNCISLHAQFELQVGTKSFGRVGQYRLGMWDKIVLVCGTKLSGRVVFLKWQVIKHQGDGEQTFCYAFSMSSMYKYTHCYIWYIHYM